MSSLEAFRAKRPVEAADIEAAMRVYPAGHEISVFKHVYEDLRRIFKVPPGKPVLLENHVIVCGQMKRPRAKKRPQEAFAL